MDKVHTLMERRQIEALIKYDPILIVIERTTEIDDGAGGMKKGPKVTLKPQRVTIIPLKRRTSQLLTSTELGDLVDLPYVVVGKHTVDIQRGDQFTYRGDLFVVESIDFKDQVRQSAIVDYFGGRTNG